MPFNLRFIYGKYFLNLCSYCIGFLDGFFNFLQNPLSVIVRTIVGKHNLLMIHFFLSITEYLFENGRIDNIFVDMYYEPFTSALHEVIKDFKLPVNELGYFVTRIEEEHLWESKQLGAHSPQVLLSTLIYFNAKYFMMKTLDDHIKLSFTHIMKHWKKGGTATPATKHPPVPGEKRATLLRYYPPAHMKGNYIDT